MVLSDLIQISKETNRMEKVEEGLVHDWGQVQLVFRNPSIHHGTSTTSSGVGLEE